MRVKETGREEESEVALYEGERGGGGGDADTWFIVNTTDARKELGEGRIVMEGRRGGETEMMEREIFVCS